MSPFTSAASARTSERMIFLLEGSAEFSGGHVHLGTTLPGDSVIDQLELPLHLGEPHPPREHAHRPLQPIGGFIHSATANHPGERVGGRCDAPLERIEDPVAAVSVPAGERCHARREGNSEVAQRWSESLKLLDHPTDPRTV